MPPPAPGWVKSCEVEFSVQMIRSVAAVPDFGRRQQVRARKELEAESCCWGVWLDKREACSCFSLPPLAPTSRYTCSFSTFTFFGAKVLLLLLRAATRAPLSSAGRAIANLQSAPST